MDQVRTVIQPSVKRCKSVTLTPGYWIYVCPCGFQYSVSLVTKRSDKHAIYCFKCRGQTGKYYKVMIERVEFTQNWNGKLNCGSFTIMRLHNPVKYCIGAVKQIYLKGVWKGNAKIIDIRRIHLNDINLFTAKLDTGLSVDNCREVIRTMYKSRPGINWDIQLIDLCLMEYQKESKEPTLFK